MTEFLQEVEKANIGKIEKNVPLKNYTTYKVGGNARCIIYPKSTKELVKLVKLIKKYNLKYKILGNGSNLLFSDNDYNNVLIKLNELSNIDNDIYRELTLQKLSDESKLNIDYLRSKINKNEKIKIDNKEKTIKKNKYEIIEQNLIYQMLCSKEAIKIFAKNRPLIENEINKKIINKIGLYYKEKGNIILADIITYFDSELRKVVNSIINSNVDKDYDEKELMSYINSLNKRKLKKEIDFKNELIKKEIDPIKKAQILNEIIELKKTEEIK